MLAAMRMLIALLSNPPPALAFFLMPAAVLVFAFLTFSALPSPFDPLVLSVVAVIAFNAARILPVHFARPDIDPEVRRPAIAAVALLLALLLWKNDALWCQRVPTVMLSLKAAFLAHAMWRAPDDLESLGAPVSGPDWFRDDWARWKIVALGLTVLVNEVAIRFATQAEWVVVMAILPAVIYCLLYWTLTALAWDREH